MNAELLLALAGGIKKDDLSRFDQLPSELQAALQEEQTEERKQAAKRAAREVMDLLKQSDNTSAALVTDIRRMRKAIDSHKANLERLNRTKAYGLKTNNFLPLADELGLIGSFQRREIMATDPDLLRVPEDFQVEKVEG